MYTVNCTPKYVHWTVYTELCILNWVHWVLNSDYKYFTLKTVHWLHILFTDYIYYTLIIFTVHWLHILYTNWIYFTLTTYTDYTDYIIYTVHWLHILYTDYIFCTLTKYTVQDESKASHERELKRLKKASELTIQEYRETNKHLQDQV